MPAATINRDRAVAQQQQQQHLRDFQGQLLRHGSDDQCNYSATQQPGCDSNEFFDPSIHSPSSILTSGSASNQAMDDFMMSLALDENMELSKFTNASQGGTTGLTGANCDPNGMPILNAMDNRSGNRPANLEQTQLLSGSRP